MSRHIVGKVYELTQESFNSLIAQLEAEQEKNQVLSFQMKEFESRLLRVSNILVEHGLESSMVFDELDDVLALLYNINRK